MLIRLYICTTFYDLNNNNNNEHVYYANRQNNNLLYKVAWRRKKNNVVPINTLTSLEHYSFAFYPSVRKLLIIVATLPVTTASAERSFRTVNPLKTYQRSTMGSERFASLALLHIHRYLSFPPIIEVLGGFAACQNRCKLD